MDYAGGVKFGVMLAELHGKNGNTEKSIAFLEEHHESRGSRLCLKE